MFLCSFFLRAPPVREEVSTGTKDSLSFHSQMPSAVGLNIPPNVNDYSPLQVYTTSGKPALQAVPFSLADRPYSLHQRAQIVKLQTPPACWVSFGLANVSQPRTTIQNSTKLSRQDFWIRIYAVYRINRLPVVQTLFI